MTLVLAGVLEALFRNGPPGTPLSASNAVDFQDAYLTGNIWPHRFKKTAISAVGLILWRQEPFS